MSDVTRDIVEGRTAMDEAMSITAKRTIEISELREIFRERLAAICPDVPKCPHVLCGDMAYSTKLLACDIVRAIKGHNPGFDGDAFMLSIGLAPCGSSRTYAEEIKNDK